MKALLVLASLIAMSVPLHAQQRDSCLLLYRGPLLNPDSAYVDSCSASPTYGEVFQYHRFEILFDYYVIFTPVAPEDTLITVGWDAIDTNYSALRSTFHALALRFGNLHLVKGTPHLTDTGATLNHTFSLYFDSYQCVDSVMLAFGAIPMMNISYYGGPIPISSVDLESPVHIGYVASRSNVITLHPTSIGPLDCVSLLGEHVVVPYTTSDGRYSIDLSPLRPGYYLIRIGRDIYRCLVVR
jgi:hypothetical protein